MIRCRICERETRASFRAPIFGRQIQYFECPHCEYVQSETPDWLDQAYARAINDTDTGLVARCQNNVRLVTSTLFLAGKPRGRTVDFAGGYGLLTRLLRDVGVDAWWTDPFCENLLARGFEYESGSVDLVTAFEAFEHFVNPVEELGRMLEMAPRVLFSTTLCPKPVPEIGSWDYFGFDHGQHIGFFRVRTIEVMAARFGCRAVSDGEYRHLIVRDGILPTVWPIMIKARLPRFFHPLMRQLLTPLTVSDQQRMAERAKAGSSLKL